MKRAVGRPAAFYDVDGTLIKTNIVHVFAWYARNQSRPSDSLWSTVKTVASIPAFLVADQLSRKLFNEIFYGYYKGQSEDRLVLLADELFDDVIRDRIYPRAYSLIEESKRRGLHQVLVTGGLDFAMRPLHKHLGTDDLIANTLEFDRGICTGQLGKPFVAGASKAAIIRDYAQKHDIDLSRSWAYSDSYSDYPMLAIVGHPAAVNADLRLRNTARSYNWPILDLR